ncbi:hypothetical protein [Pedobacter alpinus]|uniref:Lipocalin-like domain-containing protein n=1 Tax=Pedobacter alpinus TaxID=1590643 RepID=A0ABW5TU69_9SPHI
MYLNNFQSFVYGFFVFVAIGFMACEKTNETKKIVSFGEVVELAKTESIWFGSDTLIGLKFYVDTINDIRCPEDEDIACVWAGEALVNVTAYQKSDSTNFTLKLSPTKNFKSDTVSFSLNNQSYKGILLKVDPYPNSTKSTVTKSATITVLKINF